MNSEDGARESEPAVKGALASAAVHAWGVRCEAFEPGNGTRAGYERPAGV
jgi:hypothetical protein